MGYKTFSFFAVNIPVGIDFFLFHVRHKIVNFLSRSSTPFKHIRNQYLFYNACRRLPGCVFNSRHPRSSWKPFFVNTKGDKKVVHCSTPVYLKIGALFLLFFIVAHIERIIKTASAERVTRLRNNNNNISASMTKMKRKNIHLYYRFTFQKRVPYSRQDSCADSVAADAVKIDACVHYFTLTKMITPSHFSS